MFGMIESCLSKVSSGTDLIEDSDVVHRAEW